MKSNNKFQQMYEEGSSQLSMGERRAIIWLTRLIYFSVCLGVFFIISFLSVWLAIALTLILLGILLMADRHVCSQEGIYW